MRLLLFICILIFPFVSPAQTDTAQKIIDTLAPYQKSPIIPTFSIQTIDSTWFFNTDIKKKSPVLIVYFSPSCGHCQIETENLIANISKLSKLQIIMITSHAFQDMYDFSVRYKLNKFPSIILGRDPARVITRFYNVQFTPFSALYDKKGKLVKAYTSGLNMQELIKFVN